MVLKKELKSLQVESTHVAQCYTRNCKYIRSIPARAKNISLHACRTLKFQQIYISNAFIEPQLRIVCF